MQKIQQPFHTDHCHGNTLSDGSMRHQAGGARSQYSRLAWPFLATFGLLSSLISSRFNWISFRFWTYVLCSFAWLEHKTLSIWKGWLNGKIWRFLVFYSPSTCCPGSPPTLSHLVSFLLLINSFLYTALPPPCPPPNCDSSTNPCTLIIFFLLFFYFLILMYSILES